MKRKFLVFVAIAAAALISWQIVQSQEAAGPMDESQVIVAQYEWNGVHQISLADLNAAIKDLPRYRRTKYQTKKGKTTYLEELINEKLKLLAAIEQGFDKDEGFHKNREEYKHQLMIERLTEMEVDEKVSVTEEDFQQYYEENKDTYIEKAKVRATCITVTDEELAHETLEQIKGGKDILEMAKELSAQGKLAGPGSNPDEPGNTGLFSRDASIKAQDFTDAVFEMELGETTEHVFELDIDEQTYYMIFRKEEHKPERQKLFEEVKSRVEYPVKREKKRQRITEWVAGVTAQGKLKTYPERIPEPPPEEDVQEEQSEK
ncbi:MAG: peptidyl-prolyl cis-trans isomerase [Candidatus Poribacteria bacterium]|nr:peptidyl-prolyl cis-trans isomerase [Candidatus Poribacteria bacterium]